MTTEVESKDVEVPKTPAKAVTKKSKAPVSAKPKAKKIAASHPPTSTMVPNAIGTLKEKSGSSLQAIKKYISATYKIDADKLAPFIKKYLISAVEKGELIRTKGKGAAGSFKLSTVKTEPKKAKAAKSKAKPVKKTEKKVKTAKKPVTKKAVTTKKESKPKVVKKKPASAPKKSPAKVTKPKPTAVKSKTAKKTTVKKAAPKKSKK